MNAWSRSSRSGGSSRAAKAAFAADPARTADAIRPFSARDAAAYPAFCATLERLVGFLADLLEMTPPDMDAPAAGEVWELLKTGRRFRALGKGDSFRLLRWGPMAAADLVAEWFETDLLQAAVAARGVFAPLLLTDDAARLPRPLEEYFLSVQPGYENDPGEAVYNRAWILGDEDAVSVEQQAQVDVIMELIPVQANAP